MSPSPEARTRAQSLTFALSDGQLETLKWLAFGTMLIDHFGRHAFSLSEHSWAFAVSRVTFPLFALVLAANLARPGDRYGRARRTAQRLALWAIVSVAPSIWARDAVLPINVLATLALGTMLYAVLLMTIPWGVRVAVTMTAVAASILVEFSVPGMLLVPALAWLLAFRGQIALVASGVAFSLVAGVNLAVGGLEALLGTLAVLPIALLVSRSALHVPRLKWLFYVGYPLHLMAVGALRAALAT